MTQPLETMLQVLRCPRSHTPLHLDQGRLVSRDGDEYPIVDGKPVLIRQITDVHLNPPREDCVSQNIPSFEVPRGIEDPDASVLHLGSGNVPSADPRVISLDVLPCENVDLVGEAESLPFLDRTFDYVESGAVFEHLHDPLEAIREVRRVLKPGGRFRIDTAFLQGYHGYPGHYFNMTPLAIETFLVDDFDLEQSTVPDSATPIHTVLDLLQRFLTQVDAADRERLLTMPLREVLELLRADETRTNPLLRTFDEHPLRALCASFVVIARKPDAYEARSAQRLSEDEAAVHEWRALKREYYAARAELIHRHHEVGFYRRLAEESVRDTPDVEEPGALDALLKACKPASMLEPAAIRAAVDGLRAKEAGLARLRDQWIGAAASPSAADRVRRKVGRLRSSRLRRGR